MIDFFDLVEERRSIRQFTQEPIEIDKLYKCVEVARVSPQGANVQPIKYGIIHNETLVRSIFPFTKWAGYLPDYNPSIEEGPVAYIILYIDENIKKKADVDAGIAGQSIIFAAQAQGIFSCWLGAIDRQAIGKLLNVSDTYAIHSIIALGYPKVTSDIVNVEGKAGIKYYFGEDGRLKVPKRNLNNVVFEGAFNEKEVYDE